MATITELLRKNLTPEVYGQVMDALGDDFDFDLVPRSRLNKVIKQRNDLREKLNGASQNPDADDDGDGVEGGEPTGKGGASGQGTGKGGAEGDIKALQKQHKTELANLAIRYSALDKLRAAKAKNPELILKAGLLDTSVAKVSDDGATVTWPEGDKDPFVALAGNKDYAYLFDAASVGGDAGKGDDGVPPGTGKDGGDGGGKGGSDLDALLDQAMGVASAVTPVGSEG